MRYVYHVCASFDSGGRTIEFDGLSITNLPITTLDSYVSLRQSFRDNYELEKEEVLKPKKDEFRLERFKSKSPLPERVVEKKIPWAIC